VNFILQLIGDIGLLVLSIALLWKGSDWLIDSATRIGRTAGLSDLVIGLTIVAFGTSAPEFAVTIFAAIQGQSDISVGNIVGSNIFNLGFILGGCAIVRVQDIARQLVYRDGLLMIGSATVLAVMLTGLTLSRLEGILLITGLFAYVLLLFYQRATLEEQVPAGRAAWKDYFLLTVGIGFIVGGGHLLVRAASSLAGLAGLSEWAVAVTIVAAGTSSPEFATSLNAAFKGRHGISVGNIVGSNLFNILGVLGLAGIIRPMALSQEALYNIYMLLGICVVSVFFMRTGWKISRREGLTLATLGIMQWGFGLIK